MLGCGYWSLANYYIIRDVADLYGMWILVQQEVYTLSISTHAYSALALALIYPTPPSYFLPDIYPNPPSYFLPDK